jgi:hypothetical protein
MRDDARRFAAGHVVVLAVALLAACGGNGNGSGDGGRKLQVKGHLPTLTGPAARSSARLGAAAASAVPQATKVIVAGASGGMEVWPVVNGSFDFRVSAGQPVGLVLVGLGDSYLGFVSVRPGVAILPLNAADPATTVIDLGTLVDSGTTFLPGIDPVGRGLTLSDAELAALGQLDQGFQQIVETPDGDGDGIIDWLQGRLYNPQLGFSFNGGTFAGLTGVPPAAWGVVEWTFGMNVGEVGATAYPPYATFTCPQAPGLEGLSQLARVNSSNGYTNALYTAGQRWQPGAAPPSGAYLAAYRDRTVTMTVPDLSGLAAVLPAPVPTVTLNADFTINKVSWSYRLADGTTMTASPALVRDILVQVSSRLPTPPCTNMGGGNGGYQVQVQGAGTEHVFTCQKVRWSDVDTLIVGYVDVFGNNVLTSWRVPN